MRAMVLEEFGGPESLHLRQVADPVPSPDEVYIDVRASGVAFPDVMQTRGTYHLRGEPPVIPGNEFAGFVLSAPASSAFRPGDRVVALNFLGGFAERAVASVDRTFALPATLPFEAAAAMPSNYLTAHFGLMNRGGLQPGDTVLVHGASGGVGSAAVQVAKAFGAGQVIGVVSTPAKAEVALAVGADQVVLVENFLEDVRNATGGAGVDIVVDPVGGDRFLDSIRALVDGGRLLVIGFAAGSIPTVRMNRLLLRNLSVIGVNWGVHTFTHPGFAAEEWSQLIPHIESGVLAPAIDLVLPLERARQALERIDARLALGKIVLSIPAAAD